MNPSLHNKSGIFENKIILDENMTNLISSKTKKGMAG